MNNDQILDNFKRALTHKGLKLTTQRELIFTTLLEKGVLTNSEVANLVDGQVDRATVYRTLETFESMGLITRIWNGWKSKVELSDAFIAHHHHATCNNCGKVLRIESEELEKMLCTIAEGMTFSMSSHTVELYGLCEGCSD